MKKVQRESKEWILVWQNGELSSRTENKFLTEAAFLNFVCLLSISSFYMCVCLCESFS